MNNQKGSVAIIVLVASALFFLGSSLFALNNKLGSGGRTILNDPDAASVPVVLTTDVSGVLPQANGGSNASTDFTAGSVLFDSGSAFAQNNSRLFWDNTNFRLGVASGTPGVQLGVQGTILADALIRASSFIATSTAGSGFGTTSPGAVLAVDGGGIFGGTLYVESTTTVNSLIATSTGAEIRRGGITTNCISVSDGVVNPRESQCFEVATTTDGAVEVDVSDIKTGERFSIVVYAYHDHTTGNSDIYFTNSGTASGTRYTSATDTPWAVSPGAGEVDVCTLWNATSTAVIDGSCLPNLNYF